MKKGSRKASFCFFVACLFGDTSSLSSSQAGSLRPKFSPDDFFLRGSSSGNARIPQRNSICLQKQSKSRSHNAGGVTVQSRRLQNLISSSVVEGSVSDSFRHILNEVTDQLGDDNDLDQPKIMITGMVEYLKTNSLCLNATTPERECEKIEPYISQKEHRLISEVIDEAFNLFFTTAFSPMILRNANHKRGQLNMNHQEKWHRVALGIELLQLQLGSSDILVYPFYNVPKRVIVMALTAVTSLQEQQQGQYNEVHMNDEATFIHTDMAFRLLQRLVTGVGVRNSLRSKHFKSAKGKRSNKGYASRKPAQLYEVDFNRVLNMYSSSGKMDMAHRVIALQERTPHAPALSPVTYSILVKGYGKLFDSDNIDMLLRHAAATTDANEKNMKPDTIFFNSLMDAYINCGQFYKAETILTAMITNDRSVLAVNDDNILEKKPKNSKNDFFTFAPHLCPPPNLRSYNILLKGYAKQGLIEEALELTEEMKSIGSQKGNERYWWDHVTTNTLVQAAVVAKQFETAKNILIQYTSSENQTSNRRRHHRRDHPNADAYTSLMDGLSKDGKINEAMGILTTMKAYKVKPNEYHYSCLIGSLAREKKIFYAENILAHVKASGIINKRHQKSIYNAFISGLVERSSRHPRSQVNIDSHDENVDKALLIMKNMIEDRVLPDANTVAIVLDGFGHCQRPRMKEAVTLVKNLESLAIIPTNDIRVTTALIRVCASCNNLDAAIKCFRRISCPDVTAINALIDAAVRTGNKKIAVETFGRYFWGDKPRAIPDVISFSVLIGAHFKSESHDDSRAARELYQEMRFGHRIFPDKYLVDTIIRGMVETSRNRAVLASDARFIARVLRDAEKLDWGEGELDSKKSEIDSLMNKHAPESWQEEAELYGLWKSNGISEKLGDDNLFQRHGWNEVDSGFRLWGAGAGKTTDRNTDSFLQSKGWNDFDSGFHLFF